MELRTGSRSSFEDVSPKVVVRETGL